MSSFDESHTCTGHHADESNYVLAGALITDLPELERWCATLPHDAWGTVFVEVFTPQQIRTVNTPPQVSVIWLCRENRAFLTATGHCPPKGALLTRALDAWLDEWVRADPFAGDHYYIWAGGRSTPALSSYWAQLEAELTRLWSGEALPRA